MHPASPIALLSQFESSLPPHPPPLACSLSNVPPKVDTHPLKSKVPCTLLWLVPLSSTAAIAHLSTPCRTSLPNPPDPCAVITIPGSTQLRLNLQRASALCPVMPLLCCIPVVEFVRRSSLLSLTDMHTKSDWIARSRTLGSRCRRCRLQSQPGLPLPRPQCSAQPLQLLCIYGCECRWEVCSAGRGNTKRAGSLPVHLVHLQLLHPCMHMHACMQ